MADIEKTQGSKLQNSGQKLGEKCRLCIEKLELGRDFRRHKSSVGGGGGFDGGCDTGKVLSF